MYDIGTNTLNEKNNHRSIMLVLYNYYVILLSMLCISYIGI